MNDPTHYRAGYFTAVHDEENAASDALRAIRAEEDEGNISAAQAAAERIQLLEAHLARLARLRAEYTGGAS